MKTKKFNATYLIHIKGSGKAGERVITSQMLRDKIVTVLQEMWILHHLDGFSLEEVTKKFGRDGV